jgi:hypothetical protein
MKRFGKVPVYIFDEHQEAFYFWHKAKYEGYINRPLDLFHVDAHEDMSRTIQFTKSIYFPQHSENDYLKYYEEFTKNELNIANFILPGVLNRLVKNIYFIFPRWRNFKPRRKKMNICSAFGEGKVIKYSLKINDNVDKRVFKAYSDLKHFNFSMHGIDKTPKNRNVILDIDLDYFACIDSILNHMRYELEITEEQFLKKEIFLSDKTISFAGLDFGFVVKDEKYYVQIGHKKVKDVFHLPPQEEIESEIDTLVSTLQTKNIRPIVVTICRSCISGYCPKDYYEFIETELKKKLRILLGH